MYDKSLKDKIRGGFIGVAVGDALGCTLEFTKPHSITIKHTEIIGGGPFKWFKGEVTDDTDMTLCVARGILNNPSNPIESIGNEFVEWHSTLPVDIGTTCLLSIQHYINTRDWVEAPKRTHRTLSGKSAGNGSLMRCIPVALYYNEVNDMLRFTAAQSRLTHYSDISTDCCLLYNSLVKLIMDGNSDKELLLEYVFTNSEFKDIIKLSKGDLIPSGYSMDSLKCALWCFFNTQSFEDAVIEAVNLGGDSDTVGAITGGLAGVYYGYKNIPKRWRKALLLKEEIIEMSNKFIK